MHYGKVRGDAVEIIEVKWVNGTGRWWPSRTVERRSWFWISRKGYESRGFGQRPDERVSRQYQQFVQGAPGATHRVERRTGINSTYECIERGAVPEPIIVGGQRVSGQPIGRGQRRLGKGHPGDPSVIDGVSLMKTVINQLQFNPMQVAQKRNQRCYDHLLPTHEWDGEDLRVHAKAKSKSNWRVGSPFLSFGFTLAWPFARHDCFTHWSSKLKRLLNLAGLGDIWSAKTNTPAIMNYIRQRLLDIEQQTWISEIHNDERKDPHQKNKLLLLLLLFA